MFHMMNEARIAIGMAATMLGLAGYYVAGLRKTACRPAAPWGGSRTPAAQVRLIEHADIKAHAAGAKAYGEGALALLLYCACWWTSSTRARPKRPTKPRLLLEVLTPIARAGRASGA